MAMQCKHGGECAGCMACQAEEEKYCPICGAKDPEWFYEDKSGEPVGCEMCVSRTDWAEWSETA